MLIRTPDWPPMLVAALAMFALAALDLAGATSILRIDRFHYGVQPPQGAWVAVLVLLLTQGYLMLALAGRDAQLVLN